MLETSSTRGGAGEGSEGEGRPGFGGSEEEKERRRRRREGLCGGGGGGGERRWRREGRRWERARLMAEEAAEGVRVSPP